MKRTILLCGMIGMALLLTSCLEEGNRNYDETSVAYMATDMASGRVYGRTLTGRLITSQNMQLMYPGTFHFMRYSWNEENGTTPISISATSTDVLQADNVVIMGDPVEIERVPLLLNQEPPVVETPRKFVDIDQPVYAADEIYLGDHWLFQYAYEAKEGESANVHFYYMEDPEATDNEITIVIDLTIMGEPGTGSVTTKTDIIALDMSQLRAIYEGSSQTNTKELQITFQYYLKGRDQMVDTQVYRMTVQGD